MRLIAPLPVGMTIAESTGSGFDGLELHASFDPAVDTSGNAFLSDPALMPNVLCLAVPLFSVDGRFNRAEVEHAAELKFPLLRLHANRPVGRLESELNAVAAAGQILLLDFPGTPAQVWHTIDRIDHSSVRYFYRATDGGAAVSTLNSRIGGVHLDPFHPSARHVVHRLRGIGYDGAYFVNSATAETRQAARAL